ncbi:hypothetical protein HAV22_20360 [Massilia sp. TW-1]|uniref:Uncharacterized protein n=1 Tax=Telluria antibiotica TaxID=2717319 RepID=A0ABX0PGM3_9BURK|nr:hypothetical protein [Telluria antibiotica]NIA55991.1 hypothetical protein [Telluria antibiotica]
MRTIVLAGLLTAAAAATREPLPNQPAPAPVKPTALPSEDAIRAAVRETLAEHPDNPRLHEADTYRANHYDIFARNVDEATVPDCLHKDGLKRQPTFFLGGLLALPFIAVAKVRGKCQ